MQHKVATAIDEPEINHIGRDAPREPDEIRASAHFLRRFSDEHGPTHETRRGPRITSEVVEACVRAGVISPGKGHTLLYETEVDGYEWRLVVGFETGTAVAVTAYVPGVHGRRREQEVGR